VYGVCGVCEWCVCMECVVCVVCLCVCVYVLCVLCVYTRADLCMLWEMPLGTAAQPESNFSQQNAT